MAIDAKIITALQTEVTALRILCQNLETRLNEVEEKTDDHHKILVTGDGSRLPLAEIVRTLSTTINDYISRKNREEEASREEWNKLKWVIVGFIVPTSLGLIGQAIILYLRVIPILEKLSTP